MTRGCPSTVEADDCAPQYYQRKIVYFQSYPRSPTPNATFACTAGGTSRTASLGPCVSCRGTSASGSRVSSRVRTRSTMAASPANGSSSRTKCSTELRPVQVYCAQINRASSVNPEYLDYKFIDRVLGLTVIQHRFLNAYFVLGFYKMVPNKR